MNNLICCDITSLIFFCLGMIRLFWVSHGVRWTSESFFPNSENHCHGYFDKDYMKPIDCSQYYGQFSDINSSILWIRAPIHFCVFSLISVSHFYCIEFSLFWNNLLLNIYIFMTIVNWISLLIYLFVKSLLVY